MLLLGKLNVNILNFKLEFILSYLPYNYNFCYIIVAIN